MSESPTTSSLPTAAARLHRRAGVLLSLCAAAATILATHATLTAGFTSGDDQRFVTEHLLVARPSLSHAIELMTTVHGDLYQPLPMISFQLNQAFADRLPNSRFGVSAYGFHLTNVVIHAINAALAALLAWRISRRMAIGLLVGLLFACHPFTIEPVAWVSGRMMLLGAMFSLLTLLICLGPISSRNDRGEGSAHAQFAQTIGAVSCWIAALLCKVLPAVPFAAAWIAFRENAMSAWKSKLRYLTLILLMAAGAGLAAYTSRVAGFVTDDSEFASTPVVRFLCGARYYLENYIYPATLSPWVPPPNDVPLGSLTSLVGIGEIALLFFAALLLRKRLPTGYIGIVLFVLLLAPFMAAPAARRFAAADRYMYLPIFGLHLALAAALVRASDWLNRRFTPSMPHRFLVLPMLVILLPWILRCWSQSQFWKDTVSRDARVLAMYPDEPLAHYEYAKALNFDDRPNDAMRVLTDALGRWPNNPRLLAQLGEAYRQAGDWRSAEQALRQALKGMPRHSTTLYHLALVLDQLQRRAEAIDILTTLIQSRPGFLPALTTLGRWRIEAGDTTAGVEALEDALRVNPNSRTAHFELARHFMSQSRWQEAIDHLKCITRLSEDDAQAQFQLAIALSGAGHTAEAIAVYDRLIEKDESNIAIRLNRASALAFIGNTDRAEQDYIYIATERPDLLEPFVALHEILAEQRRFDRILEFWQFRVESLGANGETLACLAWGQMLSGRMRAAEETTSRISHDDENLRLAQWTTVYRAAIEKDDSGLAKGLGELASNDFIGEFASPEARWRFRIIESSMAALPRDVKQSRAGRYLLGCLLLEAGQRDSALIAFKAITHEAADDQWTAASRSRIKSIEASARESTTSSPAMPTN
ncbi:MAG: tetratricopeptide repeat protein [Phycisphaerae bacterium]|nr:tetratricopeptide repeat protein [Phycisphaerae bacterium]